jgi:hypothetical protein
MNFFRSEVNIESYTGSDRKKARGIISLDDLMQLFSGPYFQNRRNPDYFSKMGSYLPDMIATLDTLENAGPYWRMKWYEKLSVTLGLKLGLM